MKDLAIFETLDRAEQLLNLVRNYEIESSQLEIRGRFWKLGASSFGSVRDGSSLTSIRLNCCKSQPKIFADQCDAT
jgi:hypothetical protein